MAVFNAGNRPHRQHFYGNSTDQLILSQQIPT